jgi:hypothetical protein
MFARGSRYDGIATATIGVTLPDGETRQLRYVRRRFLPPRDEQTTLLEHRLAAGERLDLLAARFTGDPLQFWRICDANDVMQPEELEVVGTLVAISLRTR